MSFHEHLRNVYCRMSAQRFRHTVDLAYDSEAFVSIALTTEYGQRIYGDLCSCE